jgi:hypothetical protein
MTTAQFSLTAIDCPSPLALATFYAQLTGLAIEPLGDFPEADVTWIELLNDGQPTLAFQKIENYVAPTWPEGAIPQQMHCDFLVDNLDIGEVHALSLGATKAAFQPGTTFRVYLDPIGHPFCLVQRSSD